MNLKINLDLHRKDDNDSRLRLLYRLSCGLRRQLGKKVQEMGGNAVLAYTQSFDVEGDSGIVARACGTACKIFSVGALKGRLTYNGVSPKVQTPPSSPRMQARNSYSPLMYGANTTVAPPSPLSLASKSLVEDRKYHRHEEKDAEKNSALLENKKYLQRLPLQQNHHRTSVVAAVMVLVSLIESHIVERVHGISSTQKICQVHPTCKIYHEKCNCSLSAVSSHRCACV